MVQEEPETAAGEKIWRLVKLFQQPINQTPASFCSGRTIGAVNGHIERVFLDIKHIFFSLLATCVT